MARGASGWAALRSRQASERPRMRPTARSTRWAEPYARPIADPPDCSERKRADRRPDRSILPPTPLALCAAAVALALIGAEPKALARRPATAMRRTRGEPPP